MVLFPRKLQINLTQYILFYLADNGDDVKISIFEHFECLLSHFIKFLGYPSFHPYHSLSDPFLSFFVSYFVFARRLELG